MPPVAATAASAPLEHDRPKLRKTQPNGAPKAPNVGKLGPDIEVLTHPDAPWTKNERFGYVKLRQICWPQDDGRLVSEPISARELAVMLDCSKRTVRRFIRVGRLCGLLTAESGWEDGQREKTTFEFHPKIAVEALAWGGRKNRPKSWDPHKKAPGGGGDIFPTAYSAELAAAELAARAAPNDPKLAAFVRELRRADRKERGIARLRALLAAREPGLDTAAASVAKARAAAGMSPPPAPPPPEEQLDELDATPEEQLVEEPPVDGAGAGAPTLVDLTTVPVLDELDAKILGILREYSPLAPLATPAKARLLGDTARTYQKELLVRLALERLATRILRKDLRKDGTPYRPDIAVARAFVRDVRVTKHGAIPQVRLDQLDEHLAAKAAAEAAEADEPTPEELAAMRTGLEAVKALDPAPAGAELGGAAAAGVLAAIPDVPTLGSIPRPRL